LAFQQQFKGRFGAILIRIGAISEDALLPVLAEQLNLPLFASSELPPRLSDSECHPVERTFSRLVSGSACAGLEGADSIIQCASRNR